MNIETVAVYSEVDRNAMHVHLADQAHQIGTGNEPQKSYLNQEELLELALKHRADAVHPGYGFLSENAEFSSSCQREGVIFVGPRPESIRSMGIKNESKRIMIGANVPVVPGYHGDEQTNERLLDEAKKIGFPVLIKPVRGGGGKGMRIVWKLEDFLDQLESSRRESLKSFNDSSMLIEKFIQKPRHIEVQVFGDLHGNHVYLFERDCSIQRRHQKIIEEAPAPFLENDKRCELGQMAVAAAKAVDYVGAGTVEFIMDRSTSEFHFMEMNTRLQVEHPITEMITSTDLVQWQLLVAAGHRLPKLQDEIRFSGHAFEARIYAENPSQDFLPQTGELELVSLPSSDDDHSGKLIRLDTGVRQGDFISPFYDPMISKLIVWGENRDEALNRMVKALSNYRILGLETNIGFLQKLVSVKSFKEADIGTDFIDLHQEQLLESKSSTTSELSPELVAEIVSIIFQLIGAAESDANQHNVSNHSSLRSFRTIGHRGPIYRFEGLKIVDNFGDESRFDVDFQSSGVSSGHMKVMTHEDKVELFSGPVHADFLDQKQRSVILASLDNGRTRFRFEAKSPILCNDTKSRLLLRNESLGQTHEIELPTKNLFRKSGAQNMANMVGNPLEARAPMPGLVEKVLVKAGDRVEVGQSLVILSAMKMEYTIKSATSGRVQQVNCKPGESVPKELVLVRLEEEVGAESQPR